MTKTSTGYSDPTVLSSRDWVHENGSRIYLSAVTLMETRFGIEKSRHKGATKKAAALEGWLAAALSAHRSRILPVTAHVASKAGDLLWRATAAGEAPSSEDAMIAATAATEGLIVLSRNGRHMQGSRVEWRDPLNNLPK